MKFGRRECLPSIRALALPGCLPAHVFCAALLHFVYKERRRTQASPSTGELPVGVTLERKKAEVLPGHQSRSFTGVWPQWDGKMVRLGFPACAHVMGCVFSYVSIYSTLSSLCQPMSFLHSWHYYRCGFPWLLSPLHMVSSQLGLCADWLSTPEYSYTPLTGRLHFQSQATGPRLRRSLAACPLGDFPLCGHLWRSGWSRLRVGLPGETWPTQVFTGSRQAMSVDRRVWV